MSGMIKKTLKLLVIYLRLQENKEKPRNTIQVFGEVFATICNYDIWHKDFQTRLLTQCVFIGAKI